MKTRLFALILAGSLFFCLSACSGKEKSAVNFSRGTVSDYVYTNSFAGITLSLSEEWKIYSDEEIADVYGEPTVYDENGAMVDCYDFIAQNTDGSSVTITYENLGFLYGIDMSEEDYLELTLENLRSQMAEIYEGCVCEMGEISVSGKTVPCVFASVEIEGFEIWNSLVVKKVGDVMAVISVGAVSGETIAEIFGRLSL